MDLEARLAAIIRDAETLPDHMLEPLLHARRSLVASQSTRWPWLRFKHRRNCAALLTALEQAPRIQQSGDHYNDPAFA